MSYAYLKVQVAACCLLLLTAAPCLAGPTAYTGLYTDADHSICRADVPAPYVIFTCWHWVLPSDNGAMCAEYKIQIPPTCLNTATVLNPAHSVALGDPTVGISICFAECQTDWFWTSQLSILPTSTIVQVIELVGHPDTGVYQLANCEAGYPVEPVLLLNNLHINEDCGGP
ncbi:MAG TPA: hypothetical protein VLA34_01940 [Candidatus Krumholzibacterium sp.]|nr:hypothetical protein [Candidatus Krumholzibacterium sp.]